MSDLPCRTDVEAPASPAHEVCRQCEVSVPISRLAQLTEVDPNFADPICYKCTSILLGTEPP